MVSGVAFIEKRKPSNGKQILMALCGKSERKFITSVSSKSKEVRSGVGSLLLLSIPGNGQEDWGRCHGEGPQAERSFLPHTAGAAHWEERQRLKDSFPKANLEWGSEAPCLRVKYFLHLTSLTISVGLTKAGSVLTTPS